MSLIYQSWLTLRGQLEFANLWVNRNEITNCGFRLPKPSGESRGAQQAMASTEKGVKIKKGKERKNEERKEKQGSDKRRKGGERNKD